MRPADLKAPFSSEERRIVIHDRVWYVPPICSEPFQFPGWQHADLFGNTLPVRVEYCSGNGDWIAARALSDPHSNWVAVEKKFSRIRRVWSKIKNFNLPNLIAICGEAEQVTSSFFPPNSVKEVFVNFPDPWPKRRHFKNRIMQPKFIREQHRILTTEGTLDFVTDDVPYSSWTVNMMLQPALGFAPVHPAPHYICGDIGYGVSYFERLWRDQGREIRYHRFHKSK